MALIFSIFQTFGALGLIILDRVFFERIMEAFKYEMTPDGDHFKSYGDWNIFFYGSMTLFSAIGFFTAWWGHRTITRQNKIFESTVQLASFA